MRALFTAAALPLMASLCSARNVSFWYYPSAYGGEDIDAVVALLKAHPSVVSSVMLSCGHSLAASPSGGVYVRCADTKPPAATAASARRALLPNAGGGVAFGAAAAPTCSSQAALCAKTVAGLKSTGVRAELVLDSSNITLMRRFFANKSSASALLAAGKAYGATG